MILIILCFIYSCKNKSDENKNIYIDPLMPLTNINVDSINSLLENKTENKEDTIKKEIYDDSNKYENKRIIGKKEFKVINLPLPKATVAYRKGGSVSRDVLCSVDGLDIILEDMDMSMVYNTVEFTLTTMSRKGKIIENFSKSKKFTNAQRNQLDNLHSGDKVYFENITITINDKKENIGSLAFKIE